MLNLLRNPAATDPTMIELRRRLDDFYATTSNYTAFSQAHDTEDDQSPFHELMYPIIHQMATRGEKVKVLELGAGRPSFPRNLGAMRPLVDYHAQDVTAANRDYVSSVADQFFHSDITQLKGCYDLIFSTFVLEHIASPTSFLAEVKRLLADGGVHVIFCPRYDVPGYICPSLRHLGRMGRLYATTFLTLSRLRAKLDRQPRFWINGDPAMFHGPWFRDADAVHLVSRFDVEQWHRANGFEVTRLRPTYRGLRGLIHRRLLLLSVACRKPGAGAV